ncbi:MAG TPA: thiol-disulfide oxidoreductase DCC family protein [Panacibacter sp.]|nr:thiol-disulfide oxidoreductase DCC family protein [Panacibacter sp.]HNP43186.1 thiol-disulfide oxidoreductase DCC family protein [Panacibacter sp.]
MFGIDHPVVLFDGVCNLCSSSVQFVIKHDPKKQFRFASLQSDFGQHVMEHFNLPANEFNSFILLENERIYTKSTGALRLSRKLNGLWPTLYGFMIVPAFIRDAVYSYVAKNRYRWFGKKEACWLPTPELKGLFLDNLTVAENAAKQ